MRLFLLSLLLLASCSDTIEPGKAESAVYIPDWAQGVWHYKNKENQSIKVTLYPDGSALGSDRSIGQWYFTHGGLYIVWTDGWTDMIEKDGSSFIKYGFAPGVATDDSASNQSPARKEHN